VGAVLNYLACVKDNNRGTASEGFQAMSYCQNRALLFFSHLGQHLHNKSIRLEVNAARGFVEQNDATPPNQGSRQTHKLTLAKTKILSSL
jgi:hypothetical protein